MQRARILQSFFVACGGSFSLLTHSGRTLACAHLLAEYAASGDHTLQQLEEVSRVMEDYVGGARQFEESRKPTPRGEVFTYEHEALWNELQRKVELVMLP